MSVFVVASQYLIAQHAEWHLEQHRVVGALAEKVDEGVGGGGAVGVVGADGGAVVVVRSSDGAREVTLRRGTSAGRGRGASVSARRTGEARGAGRGVGPPSARRTGEARGAGRRARGAGRGGARALTFRYLRTNRIAYSSTVGSLVAISSGAGRGLRRVRLVPTNQAPAGRHSWPRTRRDEHRRSFLGAPHCVRPPRRR